MANQIDTVEKVITRRDILKYTGYLGAAGGIVSLLNACGTQGSSQSTQKSLTAVIGYGNNQSWDPSKTASAFSMAAILHAYEPLVGGDPVTREPYAALAKSLPTNLTGTTVTFELRDGATWHDGQPVTADDVVFTYARALNPTDNVLIRSFFSLWLDSVTKVDDRTVKFNLKFPFPYVLQRVQTAMIMPKHVFDGHWDDAKAGKVVGSGPYQITAQVPLSSTSFKRFPRYNGPRPAVFETMEWKSIVDASARVAAISGPLPRVQIAENIPAANADALKTAGRTVQYADGMNNLFLLFNTKHAPFDNKLVRQALHYAIDRKQIVDIALKGAGDPARSYINPHLPGAPASIDAFPYDPAKAKSLLSQAGVSNLNVTLQSSNTSVVAASIALIKQNWDAIGVNTTLAPQDTAALFSKMDGGLDFQVLTTTGNPMQFGIDTDLLTRYYYSKDGTWMKTYARWTTLEADALYKLQDQVVQEADATKRAALEQQLQQMLADNAILFPLVFTKMGMAWDAKKLAGVRAQGYPGINLLQAKAL
ncbi:MAG: ABC transporter substrate-binding protein [Ktedonobacteraceae bacterium]|nr:ABC transporter substrate-binding protein [Ktedonobacteraceae bacterium]